MKQHSAFLPSTALLAGLLLLATCMPTAACRAQVSRTKVQAHGDLSALGALGQKFTHAQTGVEDRAGDFVGSLTTPFSPLSITFDVTSKPITIVFDKMQLRNADSVTRESPPFLALTGRSSDNQPAFAAFIAAPAGIFLRTYVGTSEFQIPIGRSNLLTQMPADDFSTIEADMAQQTVSSLPCATLSAPHVKIPKDEESTSGSQNSPEALAPTGKVGAVPLADSSRYTIYLATDFDDTLAQHPDFKDCSNAPACINTILAAQIYAASLFYEPLGIRLEVSHQYGPSDVGLSSDALTVLGQYFHLALDSEPRRNFVHHGRNTCIAYDLPILITARSLTHDSYQVGGAAMGFGCLDSHAHDSAAVVRYMPGFKYIVAHELAHLLGANHTQTAPLGIMAPVLANPPDPEGFTSISQAEIGSYISSAYQECRAGVVIPQIFVEAFQDGTDIAAGPQLGSDGYQDMCLRAAPTTISTLINRFHSRPPGAGRYTYMSPNSTAACDDTFWPIGMTSFFRPLFCYTAPHIPMSPASGNVGIEVFYKGSFATQYVPISTSIDPQKPVASPTPTLTVTPTATPTPTSTATATPTPPPAPPPLSISLSATQNAQGVKKFTSTWAPSPGCGIGVFASTKPDMSPSDKVLLTAYGLNQRTISRQGTLRMKATSLPPAQNLVYIRAEGFCNNALTAISNTVTLNPNQFPFTQATSLQDYITRLAAAIN